MFNKIFTILVLLVLVISVLPGVNIDIKIDNKLIKLDYNYSSARLYKNVSSLFGRNR